MDGNGKAIHLDMPANEWVLMMPKFPSSTCNSQDPPSLLDPPRQVKAAGKRQEAAPADLPPARALSPSLQVGGGSGILPGAERMGSSCSICLWFRFCQNERMSSWFQI